MEERIKYLASLLQKIYPGAKIDNDFKVKGTTLWKLCEFDGPGHRRVKEWAELKVRELESKTDALEFKRILMDCYKLKLERDKLYGASWKVLSVKSIANLIEMKMNRLSQLDECNVKTEDDLMDTINYAIFALLKLKGRVKNKNQ